MSEIKTASRVSVIHKVHEKADAENLPGFRVDVQFGENEQIEAQRVETMAQAVKLARSFDGLAIPPIVQIAVIK